MLKYTLDVEPIHKFINNKSMFRNKNDLNEERKQYFSNLEEINKNFQGKRDVDLDIDNKILKVEGLLSKELAHNYKYKLNKV